MSMSCKSTGTYSDSMSPKGFKSLNSQKEEDHHRNLSRQTETQSHFTIKKSFQLRIEIMRRIKCRLTKLREIQMRQVGNGIRQKVTEMIIQEALILDTTIISKQTIDIKKTSLLEAPPLLTTET